jgi:SAM-dependent methyltransferase
MHQSLLPLRAAELDAVLPLFPKGGLVLELGAGNGWQAAALVRLGYRVVALDVEQGHGFAHHPVMMYDGVHIPIRDGSIDFVYSSNVLEHVQNLPSLLRECRRVLRPGAAALHVLPSPVWRAWTTAARYVFLLLLLFKRRELPANARVLSDGGTSRPRSFSQLLQLVKRAVHEPPHGVFASSSRELLEYRRPAWRGRFQVSGWNLVTCLPTGVFYTGYGILPAMSVPVRRRLARLLGSACNIYLIEPSYAEVNGKRTAKDGNGP